MTNKHPIKDIIAILDKNIDKYITLPEGDEHTEKSINIAEEIYALTDSLLSYESENGETALKNLLGDYMASEKDAHFDLLNAILLEIISSAETTDNEAYTLMWVGINAFEDSTGSIDLDGYDTVIQNALFKCGVTYSIDDAIVMKEALPTDMIEKISLKEVYNYTGTCLSNMEIIHSFEIGHTLDKTKMLSENVKNFYIPVFIKGIFDDVIEKIVESIEIDQIFEEVSSTIFKDKTVIFIPPVLWDEATEQNAEDTLNQSKLAQMLAHIQSENEKDTELSLIKMKDTKDSYIFMTLGKNKGVIKGFLILENQTDYLSTLQEVIDFCTEMDYKFLNSTDEISPEAIKNLLSHFTNKNKVNSDTQEELEDIFYKAENIDTQEWYKILNFGATKSIH